MRRRQQNRDARGRERDPVERVRGRGQRVGSGDGLRGRATDAGFVAPDGEAADSGVGGQGLRLRLVAERVVEVRFGAGVEASLESGEGEDVGWSSGTPAEASLED